MNAFLASSIPMAVVVILAVPLVAAARSTSDAALKWALAVAALFSGAISSWQAGLLSPAVPSWVTADAAFAVQTDPEKCNQLFAVLQRYGVLTQPARPGLLVVSGSIWADLPAEAQQMAQMCAAKDGSPAEVKSVGPG